MKHAFQKFVLIFVTVLLLSARSSAQQHEELISGDFTGMSFGQFIDKIESTTSYHFYFDTAQKNEFTINISVNKKPLRLVLQQLFNQTDYHFAIDDDKHVFITRKIQI